MGIKNAAVFPEPRRNHKLANYNVEKDEVQTSLGASNDIMTLEDGWKNVLLNGSRNVIASKLNVLSHCRM
jgi:hypothetical protein